VRAWRETYELPTLLTNCSNNYGPYHFPEKLIPHTHHLRFSQPRALGRRVSDEFTVPLCRVHHRELHRQGDERSWWNKANIDPMPIALRFFWQQTRGVLPEASGKLRAHEQMTAASIEPSEVGPPSSEVNLPLRPLDADVSNRSR
jgi:hypothetical protein